MNALIIAKNWSVKKDFQAFLKFAPKSTDAAYNQP